MQALPARSSQQTKSWPDKITELKIAAHAKATSSKVLLHVQKDSSKANAWYSLQERYYIYIFGKEKKIISD